MIPTDLAAIRALIEAVDLHSIPFLRCQCETKIAFWCSRCRLVAALPAAREALKRVAAPEGCEVCGHHKGAQQTGPRNPRLEQATRDVAYWRKRAESAEALAEWLQSRLATVEGCNA